jgi:hypothetical protein
MPKTNGAQYPLSPADQARLDSPLLATLADPDRDAADLRTVVREIAITARDLGWPADAVVQSLRTHIEQRANDDLPFITFSRVLERVILWSMTVYRRPENDGEANGLHQQQASGGAH